MYALKTKLEQASVGIRDIHAFLKNESECSHAQFPVFNHITIETTQKCNTFPRMRIYRFCSDLIRTKNTIGRFRICAIVRPDCIWS